MQFVNIELQTKLKIKHELEANCNTITVTFRARGNKELQNILRGNFTGRHLEMDAPFKL